MRRRILAVICVAGVVVAGCSDESPAPVTLTPTTRATVLEADTAGGEGSGDTTADEQGGTCNDLARAYYAAIGSSGPESDVRPLYEAVTPLLAEDLRVEWTLASEAFISYDDAASRVPAGEDQLDDDETRTAYQAASADDVQGALQRVRAGIEQECPGTIDDLTTSPTPD